jgi:galactose oxidase
MRSPYPRFSAGITLLFLAITAAVVVTNHSSHDADRGHMSMLMPSTVASFTPLSPELPKTGWTATASDQAGPYPASNAIDGNSGTIWHSYYTPTVKPLPHSITIDMHAVRSVSGLTYLPRQDGSANGRIGQYSVSVSGDGQNWGAAVATGTWADDSTRKSIDFRSVVVRFVRLTALTEAGNRGPYTSAAEVGLRGDPPMGPELPRAGWTATADSQAPTYVPANVLDGNATTIWHTAYTGNYPPLPHSITIDMHANKTVTGLSYLPRQDSTLNGTIGRYSISVSTDGTSWGSAVATGTWANDQSMKYATFAGVTARYVRLTALSESGNRGQWSSAAEINLHGVAPSAAAGGVWGPMIGFPLVPVSAVSLPNNKLLVFSAVDDMSFTSVSDTITKVAILDLNTGTVTRPSDVNTHHQMFCTGLALLADGRVIINGGSGDRATTIYNPVTNTWSVGPLMNIPRAYNSTAVLSTGQALTLGGSWRDSAGGKNGELFTPSGTGGTWRSLPGVLATNILTADPAGIYRADNHAWLFGDSGGTVFHAGPSKQMNWITTTGSGSINGAGNRSDSQDAMNGNAVMYDIGKILTLGGATAYQDAGSVVNTQATQRAYTIDITRGAGQPVSVARTGNMAYARSFSNSVVLPDGTVLTFGGQQHPQAYTDTAGVRSPELWSPATGQFTAMAPETSPRNYHSVGVLLRDGRVFSGGGGLCGDGCTANHPDGQVFTPPYLLNSDGTLRTRPTITAAPSSAATGAAITVTTGAAVSKFALVRIGSSTHSVDTDQRRVPLAVTGQSGNTYTLAIPADDGVAIPGNYYLFALDAAGTPSLASIINIT